MAYDSFQNILAHDLVEKTNNAYSFDRYGRKQWFLVTRFLISENYTKEAVVQILCSKHMRWASDRGYATYRQFRKYYFNPNNDMVPHTGKTYIDRMLREKCLKLEKIYVE